MTQLARRKIKPDEDHWIPLSDLMTGLMMIFLLVAIVFMVQLKRDEAKILDTRERAKAVAQDYANLKLQLYSDLEREFKEDAQRWHASIKPDLSIRFEEPSIQFDTGSAVVKDGFKAILADFFPRYIRILTSEKYKASIEEVRIEGHTSSRWRGLSPEQAYYENMRLSQERTRGVLEYVFSLNAVRDNGTLKWLLDRVTANGLSSAHLLHLPDGSEDVIRSQRVEFRVRTLADSRIDKMLKALSQ